MRINLAEVMLLVERISKGDANKESHKKTLMS